MHTGVPVETLQLTGVFSGLCVAGITWVDWGGRCQSASQRTTDCGMPVYHSANKRAALECVLHLLPCRCSVHVLQSFTIKRGRAWFLL
jgi:hypothetical protein